MNKFIIFTFFMLGLGFYEMSGGADFVPEARPIEQIAISTKTLEAVPFDQPQVTRAAAIALPSFTNTAEEPQAEIIAAALDTTPVVEEIAETDLRQVSGKRVNMRTGLGTNYGVLDTLPRGTEAEVIEVTADGWARIRVSTTNQVGWMAERLLSDS